MALVGLVLFTINIGFLWDSEATYISPMVYVVMYLWVGVLCRGVVLVSAILSALSWMLSRTARCVGAAPDQATITYSRLDLFGDL